MGAFAYILRLVAAGMMLVTAVLIAVSFSDAVENLGRPGGSQMLGALFLAAGACFLTAFFAAGILWVLTDISEQLALKPAAVPQPTPANESKPQIA